MYEVRGDYARSAELMDRRLVLDSRPDSIAPVESLELLACSEFHRGMFTDSLRHAEQGIELYKPDVLSRTATLGENPGVGCYDWAGLSLFLLGYPDQAVQRAEQALALASEPENRYSQSLAQGQAAVLYQLRNEPARALDHSIIAVEVGFEFGFLYHVAFSGVIEAWARVMLGDCDSIAHLRDCIERALDSGARMDHNYYLGLLAEAHSACGDPGAAIKAIEEAVSTLPADRRFFYQAELLRLKGTLLLERDGLAAADEARRLFEEALEVAAGHNAKPFQLRAAAELVKLARESGEDASQAQEQLSGLLESYEEGLDTPDLKDARALLQPPG
jgi:adenylate cyclase